jgi:hypothetical protein
VADTLTGTFGKPFKEAVAAFRLRLGNLVPTAKWDDLWQDQHDRAFMVAGATKADLLADLAAAVDKAISQGTSLEEFRRDFRRIVEERGWHGWTGEGTKAGEAWRTRVIYRTNMRTSYAAGRMAQLVEGGFSLWVYRHGGSVEPRLIHLGWDGLVLPPDHPFWATHAPPNGWGCSCYVVGARSFAGAQRLGGQPGKPLPGGWQKLDQKTGAPVGIDRGWAYAPGRTAARDIAVLAPKLETLPPEPSVAVIQDWVRSTLFARWFADPTGVFPLARISDADAGRIGAQLRVASISAETAAKQKAEHAELSVLEYARVQQIIDGATEVIQDGTNNLIYVLVDPDAGGHVLVVKATMTGRGLFVTSFRRLSIREADRDRELLRLRKKGK